MPGSRRPAPHGFVGEEQQAGSGCGAPSFFPSSRGGPRLLGQEPGRGRRIREPMVSVPPDGIGLERSRDLRGRSGHVWYRRAGLCIIAVLPILALLNVFGQRPTTTSAHALAADLVVTAPARLRSGLIFEVRVKVTAHQDIEKPQLVFDPGWWESMSRDIALGSCAAIRCGGVAFTHADAAWRGAEVVLYFTKPRGAWAPGLCGCGCLGRSFRAGGDQARSPSAGALSAVDSVPRGFRRSF